MAELKHRVARRLQGFREGRDAGLSDQEFADKMGIHVSSLSEVARISAEPPPPRPPPVWAEYPPLDPAGWGPDVLLAMLGGLWIAIRAAFAVGVFAVILYGIVRFIKWAWIG